MVFLYQCMVDSTSKIVCMLDTEAPSWKSTTVTLRLLFPISLLTEFCHKTYVMLTELSTQKQFPTVTEWKRKNFTFTFSTQCYVTCLASLHIYVIWKSRTSQITKEKKNTKTNIHVSSTHFYFLFVAKPIRNNVKRGIETLNWIRQFLGLLFFLSASIYYQTQSHVVIIKRHFSIDHDNNNKKQTSPSHIKMRQSSIPFITWKKNENNRVKKILAVWTSWIPSPYILHH